MRDLILEIDARRGRQSGLAESLRRGVQSGRLRAGTPLPSTRVLAAELGWARVTVVGAYEQLVAEGLLRARRGSGTVVAPSCAFASRVVPTAMPGAAGSPRLAADFRPGEPDRSSFPRAAWAASLRRVLQQASDDLFGYDPPLGRPELRAALAAYLGRTRAVVVEPDRVVVVAGMAHGLGLLAATFAGLGVRTIAVEDPGLAHHRHIAIAAGLEVLPVPVDELGLRTDALEATGAGAVLVTPSHQYPMGVPMAPARRVELLDWARRRDGWVVEDDYDGEFRYDRQPVGALQGLDPERVVYAGTASKSLGPGLALAWLVVPAALVEPLARVRRGRGGVSTVEQAALADFMDRGLLDAHVRRRRVAYRRRREQLVEVLSNTSAPLRIAGVAAGLHITARLPPGHGDEAALLRRAASHSIGVSALSSHRFDPTAGDPGLVLGYSRPADHAYAEALARLGDFLALEVG